MEFFKFYKDYIIIKKSGLFDEKYYLEINPDIKKMKIDPLWHFVKIGWKECRNPSYGFDIKSYLINYPEVIKENINPLVHYILWNKKTKNIFNTILKIIFKVFKIIVKKPIEVKYFFKYLLKGNFGKLKNKIKQTLNSSIIEKNKIVLTESKKLEILEFSICESPLVSIIICACNNFNYTYNCLFSVLKNTQEIAYEVILVDDNSIDETRNIERYVENIRIIRNSTNKGFLLCNNFAAKYAKGEYLLFLNNDTQVQNNWLKNLIKIMDSFSKAGIVGPKLIYSNGVLQEAGGIVWKDGSACNYGKFSNPNMPEYNYLKEVDYVSGACLLIRKKLWDEIGGFDERFAPAYYEDTDLAFEVRKRGYKVIYQPESVVIHYEGVTCGKELSNGIKRFQEVNRSKFIEKWKEVLKNEYQNIGENIFLTRDRSLFKKHILIIDKTIPSFDKDAGSRTVFMWLNVLLNMEYQITFIPDDYYQYEPYVSISQQKGIEVLYGSYYAKYWREWMKENLKYFNYILLNRPEVSIKYLEYIKKIHDFKGKIIYFNHDLYYLRLLREYKVKKKKTFLKRSQKFKKIEEKICYSVDKILVPSIKEKEILLNDFCLDKIEVVPLYVYNSNFPLSKNSFIDRKGLLFVGSAHHSPNCDGIKWFLQNVWNLIKEKVADIELILVGSDLIYELKNFIKEDNKIRIYDSISDKRLKELYNEVRVAIAPLRFGAGMKGKIIEAIAYGVPIVTTEIGAEGIEDASQMMLVAKDEIEFCNFVCNLHSNNILWEKLRNKEIEFAENYLSFNYCKSVFEKIFN